MFHVKPPQGQKFFPLRRFIICSIYYNFTGYFRPLNGLKAISAYSENSAETKQIPSTTRIAVRFEKQIKYRRLKPVNEYTPPHMPKIMRLTRQIPAESLIQKLCAKTCNIMNFYRFEISPCVPFGHLVEMTKTISRNCLPYRHAMRATSPKQGGLTLTLPITGSEKHIPVANFSAAARALKNLQGVNF